MPTAAPSVTAARAELTRFLVRAQSRGILDPALFHDITATWTGTRNSLPANPEDTPAEITDDTIRAALFAILVMLRPRTKDKRVSDMVAILAALRLRQLLALHEQAQDEYERRTALLAQHLDQGLVTLRSWHLAMRYFITLHLVQQQLLGGRGQLLDRDRTEELLRRELRYLDRFADQVAARRLRGEPLSADYIRNRAQAYAGTGRGRFYALLERQSQLFKRLQPLGTLEGYGLVAEYIARDDEVTCRPCHASQGFYLLGQGPFPGAVCLGRAHCRCRRVVRYLPSVYATLV